MLPRYELRADFLPGKSPSGQARPPPDSRSGDGFAAPGAVVLSFEGAETILAPYDFGVTFGLPPQEAIELDLDAALGRRATLCIEDARASAGAVLYHGVVTSLELLPDAPAAPRAGAGPAQYAAVRLHLAPALSQLGLGEHSRVFVDQALPDILRSTLHDGGLAADDYDLRLRGAYPKLPFVGQYRESRLAFLTRWLVRVGAHYFFEQGSHKEKLVIADEGRGAQGEARAVRFLPPGNDGGVTEGFRAFRGRSDAVPRRVRAADHDDLKPLLAVQGSVAIAGGVGGDVSHFGVNERLPERATAYARARARQSLARRATFQGRGDVTGLAPCDAFALEEHPRFELNQRYVVTGVRHVGQQASAPGAAGVSSASAADAYRCDVTAVEAASPLPAPEVEWPRIHGTVRGRVDGPADAPYAQLDDHGRYLVRLLFDESGAADGAASCRVRMLQPLGGNPEGFHFPLRKGTEVEIAFLRGDPDQPVLVGVVPNAVTPSPVTSANRSQNVLQTGGRSRLEIEDAQGSEYVHLSTPSARAFLHLGAHAGLGTHNVVLSTDGDYALSTAGKLDVVVGGAQTERVAGDVGETYRSSQTTTVAGAFVETVGGGFAQTVQAGSTESVTGGSRATISAGQTRAIVGGQTETITGPLTHTVTGASSETITGSLTRAVGGDVSVTSPAGHTVSAAGGYRIETPGHVTMTALGGFNLLAPGGQRRLDASWFNAGGGTFDHSSAIHTTIASLRVDLRALYGELFGLQLAFMGLKMTTGGYLRHGAGISITTQGAYQADHALGLYGAGVQVWAF